MSQFLCSVSKSSYMQKKSQSQWIQRHNKLCNSNIMSQLLNIINLTIILCAKKEKK